MAKPPFILVAVYRWAVLLHALLMQSLLGLTKLIYYFNYVLGRAFVRPIVIALHI